MKIVLFSVLQQKKKTIFRKEKVFQWQNKYVLVTWM